MSEKAEPISRYELFENAPIRIYERAIALAKRQGYDMEEKGWEIMHQGYKDMVALNKKREAAHPTKQDLIDAIEDVLPSLLAVQYGAWDEWSGTMILREEDWGAILDSAQELQALVKKCKE